MKITHAVVGPLAMLLLILLSAGCAQVAVLPEKPDFQGDVELQRWPGEVRETSGLARYEGLNWTLNDSGNPASLLAIDDTGLLVKEVRLSGAENVDWEAMAQDEEALYVADCGNNRGKREWFTLYRVSWAALQQAPTDGEVPVTRLQVRLADYQPPENRLHNFDCEGLTVVGNELWLFSKNRGDGQTRLYRLDKHQTEQTVEPVASYPVAGLITGADYDPQTQQLVLLGYSRQRLLGYSFIWLMPVNGLPDWSRARRITLQIYAQWEAIKWLEDGRLLLSSEDSPLLGVSRGIMTPRLANDEL